MGKKKFEIDEIVEGKIDTYPTISMKSVLEDDSLSPFEETFINGYEEEFAEFKGRNDKAVKSTADRGGEINER